MWMCEARQCGAAFIDEASLERHHRTGLHHAELYCYPCDQHFRSLDSLQNHLNNSTKHTAAAAKCEHCGLLYLKDFTLVKHEESCGANWYVCQVDGCGFKNKGEIVDLHIARVHDGTKVKERVEERKAKGVDIGQRGMETESKKAPPAQQRSITVQTDETVPISTTPPALSVGGPRKREDKTYSEPPYSHQQHKAADGQETAPPRSQATQQAVTLKIEQVAKYTEAECDAVTYLDGKPAIQLENPRSESKEKKPFLHSPVATKPHSSYQKILGPGSSEATVISEASAQKKTEPIARTVAETLAQHTVKSTPQHSFTVYSYNGSASTFEDMPTPKYDESNLRIKTVLQAMEMLSQEEVRKVMLMARSGEREVQMAQKTIASVASEIELASEVEATPVTPPQKIDSPFQEASSKLRKVLNRIQEQNYTKKAGQIKSSAQPAHDTPRSKLPLNEAQRIVFGREQRELKQVGRQKESERSQAQKKNQQKLDQTLPRPQAKVVTSSSQPVRQLDGTENHIARKTVSLSQHDRASLHQTSVETPSPGDWFTPKSDILADQKTKQQALVRVPTPLEKMRKVYMRLPKISCPHCIETFEEADDFESHYLSKHAFGDGDLPLCRGCNRTFEEQKGLVYHLQDCDLGREAHFIFEKNEKPKFTTAESGSIYLREFERAQKTAALARKTHKPTSQYTPDKFRVFEDLDEYPTPTRPTINVDFQDRKNNSLANENYGRLTPPDDLSPMCLSPASGVADKTKQPEMSSLAKVSQKACDAKDWDVPASPIGDRNGENNCSTPTIDSKAKFTKETINLAQTKLNELAKQKQTFSLEEVQALLAASLGETSANAIGLPSSPQNVKTKPVKVETLEDSQWANKPSTNRTNTRRRPHGQQQLRDGSDLGGPINSRVGTGRLQADSVGAHHSGNVHGLFGREFAFSDVNDGNRGNANRGRRNGW